MDRPAPFDAALVGPCGELRLQADSICGRAQQQKLDAGSARLALQDARRELTRSQRELDTARTTADHTTIAEAKARARSAYQREVASSGPDAASGAAAAWLRDISRVNRDARLARRSLAKAGEAVRQWTRIVAEMEQRADAARIRAEIAASECLAARQRLATCEGNAGVPEPDPAVGESAAVPSAEAEPPAGNGTAATRDDSRGKPLSVQARGRRKRGPLVIEQLAMGDREAMGMVAAELATVTGHPPSHFLLLVQELVDAIRAVAAERRYLAFDDRNPFWAQFDLDERRTIMIALADLGFRFDPEEGWYGDRAPGTAELAIALAYAGHEPRSVRYQPSASELRDLPASISVSALACLSALAPGLSLSELSDLLGPRMDSLGPLWDDWARVRPVLLSEVGALATS
jgi:hypothetical protein